MRASTVRKAAAAFAGAFMAFALSAPAQAEGDDPIPQPVEFFVVDSGDSCPYGIASGTVAWYPDRSVVEVGGALSDEPSISPIRACEDDRYLSMVHVTAYRSEFIGDGEEVIGSGTELVDNGTVEFKFEFDYPGDFAPTVDRIEIKVCRSPVLGLPYPYCGTTEILTPPIPT